MGSELAELYAEDALERARIATDKYQRQEWLDAAGEWKLLAKRYRKLEEKSLPESPAFASQMTRPN